MEERREFSLQEIMKFVILVGAFVGVFLTFLGGSFLRWSEWREVPARLLAVETRLAALPDKLSPNIIDFRGAGIVSETTVYAGDSLTAVYVLRRSIDCDTVLRVRFFDHAQNILVQYQDAPAVRAPVSNTFSAFAIRVRIPSDLPPGRYSYWPEILPVQCGVYGPANAPMTEAFTVKKMGT